jgi:hypothetical protein
MMMGLVLLAGALLVTGCGVLQRAPAIGASAVKAANPLRWFGGEDGKEKGKEHQDPALDGEGEGGAVPVNPPPPTPSSATLGVVHMVDRRNDFLLIKASRKTKMEYGTPLISLGSNGHQTAELKLSPERNSQFLVADIVRGEPEIGDVVKLIGVRGEDGGIVPVGGDEVQVLE